MSSPEVIVLTAISDKHPDNKIEEFFWKSAYLSEADRLKEANGFIESMVGCGFTVIAEYRDE